MRKITIERSQTGLFRDFQIQLSENQEELIEFIGSTFSKGAFEAQIKLKKDQFNPRKREVLVKTLKQQYGSGSDKIKDQIELLSNESTFTVTTGHQLSLFTGPLFFVYKILHVIRLSESLKRNYPDYNFIPVYWMASEDHDFEEIRSVNLYNQKVTWESDQTGAVGRFHLGGFEELKSEFLSFFERFPESEIYSLIDKYNGDNLAQATRNLVHELFTNYPIVIIDGDDRELKKEFRAIMEKELSSSFSFEQVESTNERLEQRGIPRQVKPRMVNLFHLEEGKRTRIERVGEGFSLEPGGTVFSFEEISELLYHRPECFSPNVVLRPVYQEYILPNLCYTGGLGEIAYWLQLKGVFDAAEVVYPLIQIRQSVVWVDKTSAKRMQNYNIGTAEIFLSSDELISRHINTKNDAHDLSEMIHRRDELRRTFLELIEHEPTLDGVIRAEWRKIEKSIESIEGKMLKAQKSRHETEINQIRSIKEKLFPNNSWQERSINFFQLSPDGNYTQILDELYESIDPFTSNIQILTNE